MLLLIILVILISTLLIKYKLHKQRLMKYVGHLPSPKKYPLIGSAYVFIGKNTKDIYEALLKISKIDTPAAIWLGPKLHILIDKPDDLQTVLLSPNCLDKPYVYRFLPNQRGLFTSEAHVWKPNRKLLNPSFNVRILTSFIPIFNDKSTLLVQKLMLKTNSETFDVSKYVFACTLDMICATSLGYDPEIQKDRNKDFLECMESLFQVVANRIVRIWIHPTWIYKMTPSYQCEKRLFERISKLTTMIKGVKEKEYAANHRNRINDNTINSEKTFTTPQIFINELFKLSSEGKISDEDITEQLNTMIVGGNETSALIISHTILMLAMHPHYQDRVFNELRSVCLDDAVQNPIINYEMLSQFLYMEMVIKEVMRLFPIGPILARNCLADTEISNCTIPKGTFIIMSFHNLHRNTDLWGANANNFDPDHFLPDRIAARHQYAYLPFSGGSRNCIGMKYAWISMKVMLANLLLNLKFSTNLKMEELTFRWDITLKIDNKHLVRVEPSGTLLAEDQIWR